MDPRDMHDIPLDLGAAIQMIDRLRREVARRPRLAVISVEQPEPYHADTLHRIPPDTKVTITLESSTHAFLFTAIANGEGHLAEIQTKE